jgi:superfamily I DNA/RNA helicase
MVGLIQSLVESGVPPSDIRAVTFSKTMAAALETRLRLKGVASTFHSLGYLICSEVERKPVEPEKRHRLMCKLVRMYKREYKDIDRFIARMRRENITPAQAREHEDCPDYMMVCAYEAYETARHDEGWMDFDSMLADACALLEKPEVRARWSPKFLIVDEAQDTDDCQFRILQLMSQKHGNITCVGDVNQCIYSFRGAKPDNLTNFRQWFPDGQTLYLGKNYRSTQVITNFVRENAPADTPQELLDRMVAARNEKGAPIRLKMYWQDTDEAESALALARQDPLNSIILARTNRMVGLLERLCNQHNLRYHLLGKTGFWKQNEIRRAIDALKEYPALPTEAAMNLVLPTIESKYKVDDRTEKDNDALENLKSLREMSKKYNTTREFTAYGNKMMHRRNDPKGVTISTCHQAKGGEWKHVFIIGANAKGFPHAKGDPKEERRIWFVALSRAADTLRISFAGTPSPYLRRYLTDEILAKLEEHALEVDHLETQHQLFT